MRCSEVMTRDVYTCKTTDTAAFCAQLMRNHNVGIVPVVDEKKHLVGVVTDRDLAVRVLAQGKPGSVEVGNIMTPDVVTCRGDEDLHVAEKRMEEAQRSRVVVTTDGEICAGIISLSDVARVEGRRRTGKVLGAVTERERRGLW
ncbi:MAG: CBS domain-containing protein [Bdellovibrionota bacterium]